MTRAQRPPAPENAWDRLATETPPAYAAFREYLLMGAERSLESVARSLSKSRSLVGRWSMKNSWVARADAFDAAAAKRSDAAAMTEIEKRSKRQAEIAQLALEAMAAPSIELVRRINENPRTLQTMPLEELTRIAATTARALPRVVHVERLARGQSTSNVGGHRGGPLETVDRNRADAEKRAEEMSTEALDAFLLGAETQRRRAEKDAAKKSKKAKR